MTFYILFYMQMGALISALENGSPVNFVYLALTSYADKGIKHKCSCIINEMPTNEIVRSVNYGMA